MIYYKSKHTGAQVDEAVSKILNGDIEGLSIIKSDVLKIPGPKTYIGVLNSSNTSITYFADNFDNYLLYNGDVIFKINEMEDGDYEWSQDGPSISFRIDNNAQLKDSKIQILGDNDAINYYGNFYLYKDSKKISAEFISDTVIKTTPQTLSDDEKNQALTNLGIKDKLDKLVNIKYLDLVNLRGNSQLVPGQQYRITDYVTTTSQEETRSAGNLFDIIVTADSNNKLNEEARVIQHEGNSYFADCNLSAWKIWYCLDNDTTRFAWADATDGKGVIYRMIDEWNNDVPYDFKNIQFKRYKIIECAKCSTLVGKYTYREDSKYVIDKSRYIWAYTFTHINDSEDILDHSIVGATIPNSSGYCVGVYNNKISSVSSYFYLGSDKPTQFQYRLNNICFISDSNVSKGFSYGCYSNTFKSNCYSMTFGTSCNSNIFGEYCYENTFGDAIWFQTIGKECHNNIFGNGHKYNTIGDSSSNNIFGTNYKYNTLGYNCYNNEFGRDYFHNSFGNSNHGLKLGSYYSHNSFGNSNYELKFGDYLSSNVFLNNCSNIVFGSGKSDTAVIYSHYSNNFFGNNCWSLVLKETTTSSTDIQNYNFASGLQSKTIDSERGRSYETKVAKNSTGTLKIYCEADLMQ